MSWIALLWTSLIIMQSGVKSDPRQYVLDTTLEGLPFQRYTTTDKLGRTITFYLSRPKKDSQEKKLPVVLWIGGSGSQSHFGKQGDKIYGGLQNLLLQELRGRGRVLCVEKPGVKFLDQPKRPGSAEEGPPEFCQEHTLPRWVEANKSALLATLTMPEIDTSRILVTGHSEGALVSACVAGELPQVTHVAPLAGAGPTQLYSLVELAGQPRSGDQPGDAEKRRKAVYEAWAKVLAEPDSATKFWMGHPYRRWSTFLKSNSSTELLRSKAKIFLAHGSADRASFIGQFDVLRAELLAHGRDVVAERLEGADHGFRSTESNSDPSKGMQELFGRVLGWFFKN